MDDSAQEQTSRWYVLHTRSRFEKRVAAELADRSAESYLPVWRERRRWTDRERLVDWPLFPGYVFVRFADSPEARLRVLRLPGVVRLLGRGQELDAVPDGELDAVRRLLGSGAPCVAHPFLKSGAWVRVKRGPLANLEGRLVRFKNQARLVLSVELLARSVAAEIDVGEVEYLGRPCTQT